jgi:hypothetical protein
MCDAQTCYVPWLVVLTLVAAWLLKRSLCGNMPVYPVFIPRSRPAAGDEAYDAVLHEADALMPLEISNSGRFAFAPSAAALQRSYRG